jgi:hypothetical protein
VSPNQRPDSALVLETNNLRGGEADAATVAASLERLLAHLRRQAGGLEQIGELVITHDGLPERLRAGCVARAGRPITFVELAADCDYYQAKNLGFDATAAEVVIFADSDCWPDRGWLRAMLEPFRDDAVDVVAGRTTYRDDLLGIAATTIDFMYFDSPLGRASTRNFYANNVGFRRRVFAPRRFPIAEEIYRGPCQILGLDLLADEIPVHFVPAARTVHRFPDSGRELVGLRLLRGQDTTEFAPYLADSVLPRGLRWLGRLGPVSGGAVLAGRLMFSLRSIGRQDMPEVRGARKLGTAAVIVGITAVDSVGAIARGLGIMRGGGSNSVLSYHGNSDELEKANLCNSASPGYARSFRRSLVAAG